MALNRKISSALVVTTLVLLLSGGLWKLFALRFSAGDLYPPCSSLRSDPKGCRILFESLCRLPEISVKRIFSPIDQQGGKQTTVLLPGTPEYRLLRTVDRDFQSFLLSGGRVVAAARFVPPKKTREKKEKDENKDSEDEEESCASVYERWGVKLAGFTRTELKKTDREETALPILPGLSPVPWKSALWFDELTEKWTVLYRFLGKPVIIERRWGPGSVVLAADSYFLSNEALVTERNSEAIAELIGPVQLLLFDETHLGITSRENIMMLIRRYRLYGVIAALLILAALFIWQQSAGLIPKQTDTRQTDLETRTETSSMQGMTHLLKRHVPLKKLMDVIIDEWRTSFANHPAMQNKKELMDQMLEQKEENVHPVDLYNRITKIFNERKWL